MAYFVSILLKTLHCRSLQAFAFLPKMAWDDATKMSFFFKKFWIDFPDTVMDEVKLMLDKVLEVLRRYLP